MKLLKFSQLTPYISNDITFSQILLEAKTSENTLLLLILFFFFLHNNKQPLTKNGWDFYLASYTKTRSYFLLLLAEIPVYEGRQTS